MDGGRRVPRWVPAPLNFQHKSCFPEPEHKKNYHDYQTQNFWIAFVLLRGLGDILLAGRVCWQVMDLLTEKKLVLGDQWRRTSIRDVNKIQDVSPLSTLINLQELWLDYNRIQDVSPLSTLINLQELRLENNQIQDVSPLSTLINLHELHLIGNNIQDVSPLSTLINAQYLGLGDNRIDRATRPLLNVLKPKCNIFWF